MVVAFESDLAGIDRLMIDLREGEAVVGARTGGGAHPVEVFALSDVLEPTVPVARSVNAITGTNWEQVGGALTALLT